MKNNNQQNGVVVGGGDVGNLDINKIVLEIFEKEFPGAPKDELIELIADIGQTIMVESMAKMVDKVEVKDSGLAQEIKDLLSQDKSADLEVVKRISEICLMPHVNINLEEIYQDVAVDVVKDVLGK